MKKEYIEGLYDLEEEEFNEELLGLIIDDQGSFFKKIKPFLQVMIPLLVIAIFIVIAIQYSEDPQEDHRIKNYKEFVNKRQKLSAYMQTLDPHSLELRVAIEKSIQLAHSSIQPKKSDLFKGLNSNGSANYNERYLATLDALEGLLIINIEGGVDFSNSKERQWYTTQLENLGKIKLVFYEEGMQRSFFLLRVAEVKSILEEEQRKAKDTLFIEQLKEEVKEISKTESFSIVAASYLLGRWFNYQNDVNNAKRSFEVGRKYVEGYRSGFYFYPGKRPKQINPLWNEYVGCLESLSEIAFNNKKFRQSRSYLIRGFNTPTEGIELQSTKDNNEQLRFVNTQILKIKQDINTLKDAIQKPEDLVSFPEFNLNDQSIDWTLLLSLLKEGSQSIAKTPLKSIWNTLPSSIRTLVMSETFTFSLNVKEKKSLISSLNSLVSDPEFYKKITINSMELSEKGQLFLEKSQEIALSPQEITFLNRDILEKKLLGVFLNKFTLSDGTQISNRLNREQVDLLIGLYEDEIQLTTISKERKNTLTHWIKQINKDKLELSLADLKIAILDRIHYWDGVSEKIERNYDNLRNQIKYVKKEILELELETVINISQLQKLHFKEKLYHNRQLEYNIFKKEAETHLRALNKKLNNVTEELEKTLANFEVTLANYLEKQKYLRGKSIEQQKPIISQLNRQISLHQKYLQLLLGLRMKEGTISISSLGEKRKLLERNITALKLKINQLKGDDREKKQIDLALLEEEKQHTLKELNELFSPLNNVVKEIVVEEEKILQAHSLLKETEREIFRLVGRYGIEGEIQIKNKKRTTLLLASNSTIFEQKAIDEEIRYLNKEINGYHAELVILINKREGAQQFLDTFYPNLKKKHTLFYKGELSFIKEYLFDQDTLTRNYERLTKEKKLFDDIQFQQKNIIENFEYITNVFTNSSSLSSVQVNELSRYMNTIIQAKNKLSQAKSVFNSLGKESFIKQRLKAISAKGIELDILEMFQMEEQMGVDVHEYRQTFDERNDLIEELKVALIEKKELEKKQVKAARQYDQVLIDSLIPKLSEIESSIRDLSNKELEINKKLRGLVHNYRSQWSEISRYLNQLKPYMVKLDNEINSMNLKISKQNEMIQKVSETLFQTADNITKGITSLNIDDLSKIDDLILYEEKLLAKFIESRELKRKEEYYKIKALWLIGKSFYAESNLDTIKELLHSNMISDLLLEDEVRSGKMIYDEFDASYIYSNELFGSLSPENQSEINLEAWIRFLEENALSILNIELNKYFEDEAEFKAIDQSLGKKGKESIGSFLLRAKFLLGKIYLNRGLKYNKESNLEVIDNPQVQLELGKAKDAFSSVCNQAFSSKYDYTEDQKGSSGFPESKKIPIKVVNDAQTYLGVISTFKGEYTQAIQYYRSILSRIASQVGVVETRDTVIGQIEPILLDEYSFQNNLHPYYVSLLALEPLSHEILFRIGRNYQLLSEKEYKETVKTVFDTFLLNEHKSRFKDYSQRAIAYFSQVILTHAYSPFRRAALFHRATLYKKLGMLDLAAQDLLSVINQSAYLSNEMKVISLGYEGDLPTIVAPSKALAAFELGKIYFEQDNYTAATNSFLLAREKGESEEEVIKAKVEYAKSLVGAKKWLKAELFLNQLIRERQITVEQYQSLYPPDLLIELGKVKVELSDFDGAYNSFKEVFKIAPFTLVRGKELDLNVPQGISVLETDFRDSIRPLAISCFELGNLLSKENKFVEAREYYQKSKRLFHIISWKGDSLFKNRPKEEFQSYRKQALLQTRWRELKSQVQEVNFVSMISFRRLLNDQNVLNVNFSPQEMIRELNSALNEINNNEQELQKLLATVSEFYSTESMKLPEVQKRKQILTERESAKKFNKPIFKEYTALSNIRDKILLLKQASPINFIRGMIESFSKGSLENKYLNEFVLDLLPYLNLSQQDRSYMVSLNDNLENLIVIENPKEKLKGISERILEWVDRRLSITGLDIIFIPVSLESATLVDVALTQISLLATLDTRENYKQLIEIVEDYLSLSEQFPNRALSFDKIWEMVEIAALTAQSRADWFLVERYNRYLLDPSRSQYFSASESSSQPRAELALAEALIEIKQELLGEIAFSTERVKQLEKEKIIERYEEEAKKHLQKLLASKTSNVISIVIRIKAAELLEKI
jgi:hypothetical protein